MLVMKRFPCVDVAGCWWYCGILSSSGFLGFGHSTGILIDAAASRASQDLSLVNDIFCTYFRSDGSGLLWRLRTNFDLSFVLRNMYSTSEEGGRAVLSQERLPLPQKDP